MPRCSGLLRSHSPRAAGGNDLALKIKKRGGENRPRAFFMRMVNLKRERWRFPPRAGRFELRHGQRGIPRKFSLGIRLLGILFLKNYISGSLHSLMPFIAFARWRTAVKRLFQWPRFAMDTSLIFADSVARCLLKIGYISPERCGLALAKKLSFQQRQLIQHLFDPYGGTRHRLGNGQAYNFLFTCGLVYHSNHF